MVVDGHEMTASHSERDIYNGCISLMQDLMREFEEYLDFIGLPNSQEANEEKRFSVGFSTARIVERLFLWHTRHSGHTSQLLKLKELGITDDYVEFKNEREKEA